MRLGVNATELVPGFGGLEELFLANVLEKLREQRAAADIVLFINAESRGGFDGWNTITVGTGGEHPSLERAVKAVLPDVLLTPLESAPLGAGVPFVVYAMDLQVEANGAARRSWFGAAPRILNLKRITHAASAVVVPSKFVQQEFLRVLDTPMDKVVVAPLGTDGWPEDEQPCLAAKPFFLTTGEFDELEDISHIVAAIERLADENVYLIMVGNTPGGEKDWGPRVLRIEHLPVGHLAGLYQNCAAFIYPSLRAGSPFAVLQAMRAGARVVAPRTGAIPEAAGTLPLYFEPGSATSLTSALQRALNETRSERATQVKFGRQTAAAFTWDNCAWKTLAALRKA